MQFFSKTCKVKEEGNICPLFNKRKKVSDREREKDREKKESDRKQRQ